MTVTIKSLGDGQLGTTTGDMYTAPTATQSVIESIKLVNTDTSAITVNVYLTPASGTARRIAPKDLSLAAGYSFEVLEKAKTLSAGDKIQGAASVASKVDYVVSGVDTSGGISSNTTFISWLDTPDAHVAHKFVVGNAAGTACEYDAMSETDYFLDEDNMASDDASKVASQQSIKAYVATHKADVDAHGEVDVATDSGTASSDDLDITIAGGEGINTSGSGTTVTIAGEDATTANKGIVMLDTTPADEETKAPTSKWAFDHDAATTGVHGVGSDYISKTKTSQRYAFDAEGLQAFHNLLDGGDFESAADLALWGTVNCTLAAETSIVKKGSASAKLTANGTWSYIYHNVLAYAYYAGRKVTLGAWCYCPSGNDKQQRIQIYDGVDQALTIPLTQDDAWHWVTVTHTVNASPSYLQVRCLPNYGGVSDTDDILYIDGAILVEGEDCPAYMPQPSRVVWKAASEEALNLDAQESGADWTTLDLTAYTSANAKFAILFLGMHASVYGSGRIAISVRRNGDTPDQQPTLEHHSPNTVTFPRMQQTVGMDSGQIIQYATLVQDATVDFNIHVLGYIE